MRRAESYPNPMDHAEMRRDMKKEGVFCQWGLCGNPDSETIDGHALCEEHAETYRETGNFVSLSDVTEAFRGETDGD